MDWLHFRLTTGVIAGSFCLFLSLFSYLKNKSRRVNKIFALFNLFLGLWNISDVAIASAPTRTLALFLDRLSYAWATPIMPLNFFLCIELTGLQMKKRTIPRIVVSVAVFLILISFTPLLIKDIETSPSLEEVPGILFPCFMAYLIFIAFHGMYTLFLGYRFATGLKRSQLKYTFLAMFFASVAGISYLLMMIIPSVPPIYFIPEMAYTGIIAYAILRYRLMDIRIFVRRAGLLMFVYVVLLILAAPLTVWMHHEAINADHVSSGLLALEVGFVSGVLSLGPVIYAFVVRQNSYFREDTLAGLTHELKSPLAAIESALEILNEQRKLKPGNTKENEFFEMIERNSVRLERLVNDLIHVFGNKNNLVSLQTVQINNLCQRVVDSFLPQAKAKNIQLEFFPLSDDSSISCDVSKVEQVVSNLLSNAVKFTENGKVTIKLNEELSQFSVEVSDTGKGIQPDELPYVFDRFFQGQAGRRAKGTGIGLAIAKVWVEAHGGKICAESEGEGKGSLFHFTLPR